jgi:hypothetical protein
MTHSAAITETRPLLRIKAVDAQDIETLSPLIQDALVTVKDIALLPDDGASSLVMVLNRFCWENTCHPSAQTQRAHTILRLDQVQSVQYKNIDRDNPEQILGLLAIQADGSYLTFIFAENRMLRVMVTELKLYLEDVASPWPTRFVPDHPVS